MLSHGHADMGGLIKSCLHRRHGVAHEACVMVIPPSSAKGFGPGAFDHECSLADSWCQAIVRIRDERRFRRTRLMARHKPSGITTYPEQDTGFAPMWGNSDSATEKDGRTVRRHAVPKVPSHVHRRRV